MRNLDGWGSYGPNKTFSLWGLAMASLRSIELSDKPPKPTPHRQAKS
jgi:hypothetical protein